MESDNPFKSYPPRHHVELVLLVLPRGWISSGPQLRYYKMAPSLVESNRLYLQLPTKPIHCFKDAVQFELGQHWHLRQQVSDSVSVRGSTFLKAAWVLTLRCFEADEVISISYDEELDSKAGDSTAFTVRVESRWNVPLLLETLETQEEANVSSAGPQLSQTRSVCTAALRYITNSSPSLTALPFLGGKLEVSSPLHQAFAFIINIILLPISSLSSLRITTG